MRVRAATTDDLPAILEIENREIECGWAHFGTEPVRMEGALRAFQEATNRYPWLVADIEGEVVAFARSAPWKTREAYRWTTEVGVYVRPACQGQGLGRALYAKLFPAMERAGLRMVLAGIALPNPASVRLHEAVGMAYAGTLPKIGFKFGRWIDVGYWVRALGQGEP